MGTLITIVVPAMTALPKLIVSISLGTKDHVQILMAIRRHVNHQAHNGNHSVRIMKKQVLVMK